LVGVPTLMMAAYFVAKSPSKQSTPLEGKVKKDYFSFFLPFKNILGCIFGMFYRYPNLANCLLPNTGVAYHFLPLRSF
jgi:hypothetical protein